MKYINHHSLRNFNNECVRVYMCVCFDDTEIKDKSCVFVKEFNTKILNVRVCVSVLVTIMSISSGGTTCSFGDG